MFDSLFFYAAKTVSDGENRYALGWAGDRSGATLELDASFTQIDPDFATIKYAGTMIVHKIEQLPNGDLVAVPVQEQVESFTTTVKNKFTSLQGQWETGDDWAKVTCENGYAALLMQNLPDSCTFSFKLKTDAKQAGIQSLSVAVVNNGDVDHEIVKVGDTVQIFFEGEIDETHIIDTAISAYQVQINGGDVLIPE